MSSSRAAEPEPLPPYTQTQTQAPPPTTELLVTIPINYRYNEEYRAANTTFISIVPTTTLQALYDTALSAIAAEPNFKLYRNSGGLAVKRTVAYWAGANRQLTEYGERQFPWRTELREGNWAAVLRYVDRGRGYDVVEVELG